MSKPHQNPQMPSSQPSALRGPRGPLGWLLDLFSSVPFGIFLLTVLFLYCTVGSAGIFYPVKFNIFAEGSWRNYFVRQWRPFELTEFEWFHTTFFNILILLLCLNLAVTTVRRIRLSWLNLGVWMIHTGIVILCIGSVIYFGTKVEGDTPVVRRAVIIQPASAAGVKSKPVRLPAIPGNRIEVQTPQGPCTFQIADINPRWPLQSDDNKGKQTYSVSVAVTTPDKRYIRQLLDGYPQYTEDVVPGKGRFKKQPESGGKALMDESITMSLAYDPQDRFWLKDSTAIYARTAGDSDWSQRPVAGMPRYNDCITTMDDAWGDPDDLRNAINPISIDVPAVETNDPLRDASLKITGYLRYAFEQTRLLPGGATLNPVVDLHFRNNQMQGGGEQSLQLAALDPQRSSAVQGMVAFRWVNDQPGLDRLRTAAQRKLSIRVPSKESALDVVVKSDELGKADAPWVNIPGAEGYAYRIKSAADNLAMPNEDGSGTSSIWILMVELKTPTKTFNRFVADDATRTRDVTDESNPGHGMSEPDPEIFTTYTPALLAPITIVAGPGDMGLRALFNVSGEDLREAPLTTGQTVQVNDMLDMTVVAYTPTAKEESRPAIVPQAQRDADSDKVFAFAMVRLEITQGGQTQRIWLPAHRYSFADENQGDGSLSQYNPSVITLSDGRQVELLYSRESRPLPASIALDDFILTSHVGGFEPGKMGSIRDWTSALRFQDPAATTGDGWTAPVTISTNNPTSHKGYWYFQSYWDPPRGPRFQGDAPSSGLNYTGLGVGNREGVYTQLAGCCIAVTGMIYAFYIKPIIRRRKQQDALAAAAASGRLAAVPASVATSKTNGHLVGAAESSDRLNV